MRNKFAYSYSIKLCALGFSELLESIFSLLLALEAYSLQRVVEIFEEVIFDFDILIVQVERGHSIGFLM